MTPKGGILLHRSVYLGVEDVYFRHVGATLAPLVLILICHGLHGEVSSVEREIQWRDVLLLFRGHLFLLSHLFFLSLNTVFVDLPNLLLTLTMW